jgi:hypothetical protein
MYRGEPPAFDGSYGDHGIAGQPSLRQSRPPGNKHRTVAMQHGYIVGDVPNGLDLTAEGGAEQYAAEQLVV